jgi:hypothetical protein
LIEDEDGVCESANLSQKLLMTSKTHQAASQKQIKPEVRIRYSPKFDPQQQTNLNNSTENFP